MTPTLEPSQKTWLTDFQDGWQTAYYDLGFEDYIDKELDRLGRLEADWDGYGAPPIDPAIIASARKWVRELPDQVTTSPDARPRRPVVVPIPLGNLQFEWRAPPGFWRLSLKVR